MVLIAEICIYIYLRNLNLALIFAELWSIANFSVSGSELKLVKKRTVANITAWNALYFKIVRFANYPIFAFPYD